MEKEIERKYLILKSNIPSNLKQYNYSNIEQAYLLFNPTIRIRKENDKYYLTYKDKISDKVADNICRLEKNIDITKEDYYRLLKSKLGLVITKTRYFIPYNNYTIELDIFHNEYDGLTYAEVEFPSKEEALSFSIPEWFSDELTFDSKYTNASLAKGSLL